ncbi:hypothetical protein SAMN03097694_1884 [Janthinobacterium lividum]|uniref:RiboL-PSP-HEPN domain-containing protein n=1 Tax=Janthinobacterium lividum TaxID=29581 RepID=A0AB38C627_9BURK|nr:hypothetical protein [Janthinobacterium lividum]SFX38485.1 hypothetical protein SAMN03097694_1884 [Janthinobacterium lividum]
MEELVEPDNICELDIRAGMFGWSPRERHALVSSVDIVETVPEAVQRLLMTAKNLVVFSCFHYPFNMVAAQTAFSAIELAVRLRSEADGLSGNLRGLHDSMQRAINQKWIADDATLSRPLRQQQVVSPEAGLTYVEVPAAEQFVEVLGKVFPKYRNEMAHGSSIMDNLGADMVLDANRIINQIFRQTPVSNALP